MTTLLAYTQVFDPVGDSLLASSIFAALPLVTLFALLGGVKLPAHVAAAASLVVAILVAIIVYSMPADDAVLAGIEGAAFGLFPIMWIVWNAIWIYNMTERTGYFAVLRRSFERVSDDERIQAIIIAFSFGALLEALAGFGTPVAITAVMLIALGFKPIKAASVALVANTAPVAFGAIAIPIITLAGLTEIPKDELGAMVGRQTPILALFVPLILVGMVDGMRGVRQTWPAAIVGGTTFADRPVRVLELHLRRADRHRRRAPVGGLARPAPARLAARRAAARRGAADPPGDGGRRDGRPGVRGRDPPPRRRSRPPRLARRDLRRLRAVPDHHRHLRPGAVGADQGLPGQGRDRVPVARPRRRHPGGRARHRGHLPSSTG